MSRKRRNFSAKFKSDLVIELLKGEKDLNTLATENNIQPNLLRNWKREFLNNASAVFDDIEVIVIGKMDYEALLPALASAYIAAFTSHSLGLEKFSVAIKNTINLTGTKTIISVIILGILFGLTGRLFSFSLSKLKAFMGETIMNQYLRIGAMAIPLAALLFIIHGSRYSGLGTNIISAGFAGQTIYSYDWLLKLLFTIFTLAIGFQGGEVTLRTQGRKSTYQRSLLFQKFWKRRSRFCRDLTGRRRLYCSNGLRSSASARNTYKDVSFMGRRISGDRGSESIQRKGKFHSQDVCKDILQHYQRCNRN